MDSDLKKYISNRKKRDPEFAEDFEIGYEQFKLGVLLREARVKAGLTQEELARRMNTKKSAISRIENHAEDIKLSTLEKFAQAIGKTLRLRIDEEKEGYDEKKPDTIYSNVKLLAIGNDWAFKVE